MEQTAIEFGPLFAHQQRLVSRPEDRLSNKRNEPAALSSNFDPHHIQAHELGCRIAQGMADPSRRFGLRARLGSSLQLRREKRDMRRRNKSISLK